MQELGKALQVKVVPTFFIFSGVELVRVGRLYSIISMLIPFVGICPSRIHRLDFKRKPHTLQHLMCMLGVYAGTAGRETEY